MNTLRRVFVPLLCLVAAAVSAADARDVTDALRDAQKLVESIRGRHFTRSVPSEEIGGPRLKALLAEKFEEGLPVAAGDYFRALASLGLVAQADLPDLEQRLLEFYRAQVLAFYDPSAAKFFVSTDVAGHGDGLAAGAEQSLIFTHELTHALQDQHLSLDRRLRDLKSNGDAQLALDALLEGEATEVMIEGATRDIPGADEMMESALAPLLTAGLTDLDPSAAKIPEFFANQLLFPYGDGTAFIRDRKKHGGWGAIDRLWASPPATTAEILHPGQAIASARDLLPPDAAIPTPAGYRFLYSDTLGEWTLRFLLRKAEAPDADGLAARWRGDRFAFSSRGTRVAFVGRLRAADAPSALRLSEAWKKAVPTSRAIVRGSDLIVFQGYDTAPI